jgi:hypothetical protein
VSHYMVFPLPRNRLVDLDYIEREARAMQTGLHSVTWEGHGLIPEMHEWFAARRRRYQIQFYTSGYVVRMHKNLALLYKLTWGGR